MLEGGRVASYKISDFGKKKIKLVRKTNANGLAFTYKKKIIVSISHLALIRIKALPYCTDSLHNGSVVKTSHFHFSLLSLLLPLPLK